MQSIKDERKATNQKIAAFAATTIAVGLAGAYLKNKSNVNITKTLQDAKNVTDKLLKKSGTVAVSAMKSASSTAKQTVKESAKRAGQAMTDAAMVSIGTIAIAKLSDRFKSNENDSETTKNVNKIILDTATAGINAATTGNTTGKRNNSNNNSNNNTKSVGKEVTDKIGKPSNRGIDKNSNAYQSLFKDQNGNLRDEQTRATVKSLASAGYDVDQINEYLRLRDNGSISHSDEDIQYYIASVNGKSYFDELDLDLYHHGIKGQKWGVRRYQNKDGSLTPAGEK